MSSEICKRSPKAGPGNSRTRKRSKSQSEIRARRSASCDLVQLSAGCSHQEDDGANAIDSISTRENESSNVAIDDNSNGQVPSINARKMLIQYGKELVCLFALALTTYATFQGPPRISRAPPPVPLFPKDSIVQEWPGGQLNVIQNKVSVSELSLVLFYAPWCAESQFAKNAYEAVANVFYREVYFAAVNCWQPGGECRLQYAKVQAWPVLMAYYPRGIAVQYSGPWLTQPLTKFIQGLMQPYKRLSNKNELDTMQADSDSVVVGFFNSAQLQRKEFHLFVQSAIKWLEKDPFQDVQFALVTGESYRNFDVNVTPLIRLYNWNETVTMQANVKWTTEDITKWVRNSVNFITTWIHPPGRKSTILAPYLKAGPTVLFFTPKDYHTSNKDAYHMLKQIALEFHKSKNDSQDLGTSWNLLCSIRKENSDRYLKLRAKCRNMLVSKKQDEQNFYKRCNDDPNINFVNILNNSKYDKYTADADAHCYIGPKTRRSSCKQIFSQDWRSSMKSNLEENIPRMHMSMLRPELDVRSAIRLVDSTAVNLCRSISLSERNFGNIFFKNENSVDMSEFINNAHEFNRTLSFVLLDSIQYMPIAERLGIDIETMPKKSTVLIVDNENDSTYHMTGDVSTKTIANFVKNFVSGSVSRKLRATKRQPDTLKQPAQVSMKEINSIEFRKYLHESKKTSIVLFYSVQCALCSLLSQTLLLVAKILETIDVDFLRIDADDNDFEWQYTMDTYPTVVIFPRNRTSESRVFPHTLEVNVANMLGFVIANLSPEERLQAIFESCQFKRISRAAHSCSYALRKEISCSISLNLRRWRHHPNLRTEIIRKLQILQRIYLFSFQIDTLKDLELIRNDIMQYKEIRKK